MKFLTWLVFCCSSTLSFSQSISGIVRDNANFPVANARITLFNVDTTVFYETRSTSTGSYQFTVANNGNYFIGASHINTGYTQSAVAISGSTSLDIILPPDTGTGNWNIIVNSPEPLGGTNLGVLLPNSNLLFCHNTKDPFIFKPADNTVHKFVGDSLVQGCVGLGMMNDGKVIFFGGANVEVYGPGTKNFKTFNPTTQTFSPTLPLLKDFRWYPTTAPLLDGRWLIAGGGNQFNPQRTNSSEIYDPTTNSTVMVDTIAKGNEVSPIVPLYNGKILMTHRPPQLFDPNTLQWNLTGDFVQGNRMSNGDHADHELTLLPEGNVVAIGYKSFTPGNYGNMVEIYNSSTGTWSLGANNLPVRSRTKSILLPNKKILVLGGEKENPNDPTPVNAYNFTKLAHFYDPYNNTWKKLSDMNYFREYHANAIVVPDGRVIVVGGEGAPGNEPAFSVIEEFIPPYLKKGIRPVLSNLNKTVFNRPDNISFNISRTETLTKVILMSVPLVTHFMNSGNNRFIELPFTQVGNSITTTIPFDYLQAPDGYYTLIAMTDDIPSKGIVVQIFNNSILSVGIEYLNGQKTNSGNVLNWKVNCTSKEIKMDVERSDNSRNFSRIGGINATQTRCKQPFDFVDNEPLKSSNFYRLKITDFDGKVSFSKVVAIVNSDKELEFVEVFPTVVKNDATIRIASKKETTLEIVVSDINGKILSKTKRGVQKGINLVKFDCSSLSSGSYYVFGFVEGERTTTFKFVVQ